MTDEFSSDRAVAEKPEAVDGGRGAMWPHINVDEEGNVTMEWWHGSRKITFYTLGIGHGIKVWGPNMDTEMADIYPDRRCAKAFREAFEWLAETQRS